MSKFKVGDWVKIVGHKPLGVLLTKANVGNYGTVIRVSENYIGVRFSDEEDDWWWYDEGVVKYAGKSEPEPARTLTLSGTTYALTPYEEPKLVTIDDVVYVMTEVV